MKKFFVYEFGAVTGLGITLTDINNVLQTAGLIITIVAGLLAIWETQKGKRKNK